MKKNIPPTDNNETFSSNKTKTENLAVIQREKITNNNYSINRYEQNINN